MNTLPKPRYEVLHIENPLGIVSPPPCGKVGFYYDHMHIAGDLVEAEHALSTKYEQFKTGDPFICGSCGGYMVPAIQGIRRAPISERNPVEWPSPHSTQRSITMSNVIRIVCNPLGMTREVDITGWYYVILTFDDTSLHERLAYDNVVRSLSLFFGTEHVVVEEKVPDSVSTNTRALVAYISPDAYRKLRGVNITDQTPGACG